MLATWRHYGQNGCGEAMGAMRRKLENIDASLRVADRPVPPSTRMAYRVRTLGRMRDAAYHSTRGTYHGDAMLTVFLGGRGVYLRGRERQVVERGMVGLVLPGGDTGILMAAPDRPYDHIYCRFAGHEALAVAEQIRREQGGRAFFNTPLWSAVAEQMLSGIASHRGFSYRNECGEGAERLRGVDAVLMGALAVLSRVAEVMPTARLTAESLRAFLHDHVAEPVQLDRVAEHFAMSKAHLCRMTRRLLGRTVQQEWEAIKLEWAAVLLGEPSLSVAEVARRVGYEDAFYFSRVFRRRFGVAPSVYRMEANKD